jgi:RNA polymerase sigma-70 factor (ECF subfamily)
MIRPEKISVAELGALADEVLVRQAAQGSLDAFNALYERHLPKVYNWVRCVVPEADVEDVTQETFIAMMKSLRSFKGSAKFSTWLHTLASRRVADYYRARGGARPPDDLADAEQQAAPGSAGANSAENDTLMLRLAIARLPERYKDIVRLRFAEGLQFGEIAEISGLSLEATKSLFRRAIAALRTEMGETNG